VPGPRAYSALDGITREILSDGGRWDDNNGDWRETGSKLADAFSANGLPPKGQGGHRANWRVGNLSPLSVCVCVRMKKIQALVLDSYLLVSNR
jgi:hypothetical protein